MTPANQTTERDGTVANHKVRTTINPGTVLTVGDAELLDLTRQGLILPDAKAEKIEQADAKADAESKGKK